MNYNFKNLREWASIGKICACRTLYFEFSFCGGSFLLQCICNKDGPMEHTNKHKMKFLQLLIEILLHLLEVGSYFSFIKLKYFT